jgi:hypothetical protein
MKLWTIWIKINLLEERALMKDNDQERRKGNLVIFHGVREEDN